MKRIKLLSVLFLALAATTFTSCGDTEPVDPVLTQPGNGETPAGPAVFKVDFSGQTYVATATTAIIGEGLISIQGVKGTNGQAVSIVVEGTTTGTYSGEVAVMDYNPGNSSEYSYSNMFVTGTNAGSVTITSIDTVNKTISGTFNFVGEWTDTTANLPSVAFTNGAFENIPYTGGTGTEPTNPVGDEFFKATIGGTVTSFTSFDPIVTSEHLQINAINNIGSMNSESIGLTMDVNITSGTYPVADFPDQGIVANYSKGITGYIADEGAVTITSNTNGWIKGTFYFSGTNTDGTPGKVITEGSFSVKY